MLRYRIYGFLSVLIGKVELWLIDIRFAVHWRWFAARERLYATHGDALGQLPDFDELEQHHMDWVSMWHDFRDLEESYYASLPSER